MFLNIPAALANPPIEVRFVDNGCAPKFVNAAPAVTAPVPPFAIATVPVTFAAVPVTFPTIGFVTVKFVKVPTLVNEEFNIVAFNVFPVSVPAGAITAFVDTAVINPFPLVVIVGIAVDDPNAPIFELTVAKVNVALPGPLAAASPVNAVM